MAADLTLQVLRQIRDEIAAMRADTNKRLDETNKRLAGMELRISNVEENMADALKVGADIRSHEGRIRRLEIAVHLGRGRK